jgi:hypothetical protein
MDLEFVREKFDSPITKDDLRELTAQDVLDVISVFERVSFSRRKGVPFAYVDSMGSSTIGFMVVDDSFVFYLFEDGLCAKEESTGAERMERIVHHVRRTEGSYLYGVRTALQRLRIALERRTSKAPNEPEATSEEKDSPIKPCVRASLQEEQIRYAASWGVLACRAEVISDSVNPGDRVIGVGPYSLLPMIVLEKWSNQSFPSSRVIMKVVKSKEDLDV